MHQHGLEQVTTLTVLHDDVDALIVLKVCTELCDVWAVECLHSLNLSLQLVIVLWVHLAFVIGLDNDLGVGGHTHCFQHGGDTACTHTIPQPMPQQSGTL